MCLKSSLNGSTLNTNVFACRVLRASACAELEFTGIYGVLCVAFSKHCKYKLFLLERSNTLQISASWAAACIKTLAAFCWSRCPKVLNCNYFRLFGNLLYEDTSMRAAAQYADIAKS